MPSIEELQTAYESLDDKIAIVSDDSINPELLIAFDYEYSGSDSKVFITTEEFIAVCPWTGLPDFGKLTIEYVPSDLCLELKSLKYYLMEFTGVGIVQEHAANKMIKALVNCCKPEEMSIELEYKVRGGIITKVLVTHKK
ncbi:MAG: 7-cyano-7-deazaguanine reductase [Chloroflexi bacterium]|jgi:7-cyano-7-deazaguanine reductase|nr:MAG: 7-cyano-7-deazaguanine reductase [Chloroflexota bacterium]